ncbi:MAG: PAS domain S-box protein [Blastocatellia bacterium]
MKTVRQDALQAENDELRARLEEAEETLRALRQGEVDAIVIGEQLYLLTSAEAASNQIRGRALEQVSNAVITVDTQQRVTWMNAAAERQYGVGQTEALGRPLAEIYECLWLHPEDEAASLAALEQTGQWRGENLHRTGSGVLLRVETVVSELRNDQDVSGGWLLVIRDISERQHAEERLQASHNTFRQMVEDSPFGIYVVDADFRLTLVSTGAQKVFENVRPLLGRDFAEVLHIVWQEPFASEAIARFRHTLVTGEPYHQSRTVEQRGDISATEAYDWKIERLLLPDGRYGVVCHFYDLSERERFEAALRESEQRLRLATRAAAMFAWELDLVARTVRWGDNAMQILGLPADWLPQQMEHLPALVHAEDWERCRQEFQAALASGSDNYLTEHRICNPVTGQVFWVAAHSMIVRGAEGTPIRLYGVMQDITERKRLELERERLLTEEQRLRAVAEAHNRAKDEFLSVVSHELRNPLNAILGYTRLTRSKMHDAPTVLHNLAIIERNAKMQQQLIEDLLDTARITSGKLKLEIAPTDLHLVLEETVEVVRPTAVAKRIDLQTELREAPAQMLCDAARLRQVVWNLLQNAIKFTPEGGRVTLRVEQQGPHVRLLVSDTGRGIEPDFLPHIFDRFSQHDMTRTRRHGGLGLGLSLVKQLVELHGGTVEAASAGVGQGATFTVTLLRSAPQRASYFAPLPPSEEIHTGLESLPLAALPRLDGVRILVVDDQEEVRLLMTQTLSEWGATVTAAASGSAALAILAQTKFDVLACDIAMPDMDGYEVVKRLRMRERAQGLTPDARLPAIALTSLARTEDRLQVLAAGFQLHVAKPVELAELIMVIASLTQNQQQHAARNGGRIPATE